MLIFGVLPNSPKATTSVESSKLRSERSLINAAIVARLALPTTLGAFDADGARNDVVDVVGREVLVYRDCAPDSLGVDWRNLDELDVGGMINSFLLKQIEGLEDGGVAKLDLGDLKNLDISPADELRSACAGKTPSLRHALAAGGSDIALDVVDIDGDGISDVVVYQEDTEKRIRVVQFLVSR